MSITRRQIFENLTLMRAHLGDYERMEDKLRNATSTSNLFRNGSAE